MTTSLLLRRATYIGSVWIQFATQSLKRSVEKRDCSMGAMAVKSRNFWRNRRVLVTGGAGFIGYALAERLAELKAKVTVLDIKPNLPAHGKLRAKIAFVRGSVASKRTLKGVFGRNKFKTVFHLAAEAIVGRSNKDPEQAFETNARGTWLLLDAARSQKGIEEIVIASSDKAYGSHEKLPYREDAALRGLNPYDCSKSCTDLIAQMYAHSFAMPIAIVRCGNVYGPGDTNWSRLIPDAFRSIVKGKTLDIRSDGKFLRDYVYIDDAVDAYIVLAEKVRSKILSGEAFNFGNNDPLQVMDVLAHIRKADPRLEYRILNTAKNEIREQYLDSSKARGILGWRSRVSYATGFKETAEWYADFLS